MIFTRSETLAFFAVLILAGWALYPSEYTRGLMHRQEGDRSRAVRFFRDYLDRHPNHKGATMALASAHEAGGTPEAAVDPLLAFYRYRRGDLESGRVVLGLLKRVGQNDRAAEFRWELFEDLKKLPTPPRRKLEELAHQALQEAAARQDDKSTLRALAALAEFSGNAESYHTEMLRILIARRQLDQAIKLLRDVLRRAPENVEVRRLIIRIQRMQGDVPAALEEIRVGLTITPRDISLINDRVTLFMEGKRWREAEPDLRELIRLEPQDIGWSHELARTFLEDKRLEEGIKVYEDLILRKPGDRERWFTLIYTLNDRRLHDRAIEKLEAFLARFSGDDEAQSTLIYLYQESGQLERATDLLKARVAAAPTDPGRRHQLVSLLIEQERLEEAGEQYATLIKLEPKNKDHWLSLTYVHETLSQDLEAIKVLEGYRKAFPDDANAVEHLARLYVEQGDRQKAIELLQSSFGPKGGARIRLLAPPAVRP